MRSISNGNPIASILITAYNRKEFLIESVKSVLNQTVERKSYEIIVSKNFKDEEIDTFLMENGCISIIDHVKGIGNRLSRMIPIAKSDIIIFLEDDDLFFNNKIEQIVTLFQDKNTSYVNNSYLSIDGKGRIISAKNERKKTIRITNQKELSKKLIRLDEKQEYFGMSNISIRKNSFIPYIDSLKNVNVSPDLFFLILLTLVNGEFVFYNQVLTIYRIHNSLSNIKGGFEQFIKRRNSFWNLTIRDLDSYVNIIKYNNDLSVIKLIDIVKFQAKIHILLTNESNKSKISFEDILQSGKILLSRKKEIYLKLLFISILGFVNKNYAQRFYYKALVLDFYEKS